MSDVRLEHVTKSFGATEVIPALDLAIPSGEFAVLVGPSGCGKSTILRMIAGLEAPTSGQVLIGGQDVTRTEPSQRGVAMVFQSYALYPHMTVAENMAFGLEMAGMGREDRARAVAAAAKTLKLTPYLDRKPRALSGGQRQRVAIGRAIVREPNVFLLDEPLSNLDAELRVEMRLELARIHRELGATMIHVTHDQVEAMTLADRIVVVNGGRIEQQGPPDTLYADPDTLFVAGFLGAPKMNLLPCTVRTVEGHEARVDVPGLGLSGYPVRLRSDAAARAGEAAVFGLRPEALVADGDGPEVALEAAVIENMGAARYLYTSTSREAAIVAEIPRGLAAAPGATVTLRIAREAGLLFSTEGRRL